MIIVFNYLDFFLILEFLVWGLCLGFGFLVKKSCAGVHMESSSSYKMAGIHLSSVTQMLLLHQLSKSLYLSFAYIFALHYPIIASLNALAGIGNLCRT